MSVLPGAPKSAWPASSGASRQGPRWAQAVSSAKTGRGQQAAVSEDVGCVDKRGMSVPLIKRRRRRRDTRPDCRPAPEVTPPPFDHPRDAVFRGPCRRRREPALAPPSRRRIGDQTNGAKATRQSRSRYRRDSDHGRGHRSPAGRRGAGASPGFRSRSTAGSWPRRR